MPGEKNKANGYNGVLLVNKPMHQSSHDVVQTVRRILRERRIGHVGTLDPLAEGLLVVCVGRATKVVQFLTGFTKTYEAEVCLGRTSVTLDREGIDLALPEAAIPDLGEEELQGVLGRFRGKITQQVPAYSAVRVNGEPLYKKARRGEEVNLPSREVEITELRLLGYEKPHIRVEVTCTSGTYIRTLADDIGRELGCGGYLSALKRTRVGSLRLEGALTPEEVAVCEADGTVGERLLSYEQVLPYRGLVVRDEFGARIVEGRSPGRSDVSGVDGEFGVGETILLKSAGGNVLAIGRALVDSGSLANGDEGKIFDYLRVLN